MRAEQSANGDDDSHRTMDVSGSWQIKQSNNTLVNEPPRVFRRVHKLGGLDPWDEPADIRRMFENVLYGWFGSTA